MRPSLGQLWLRRRLAPMEAVRWFPKKLAIEVRGCRWPKIPNLGHPALLSARELFQPMKYLTEFRNGEIAQRMAREIAAVTTRPWKIMEVCGGQTHSIIKNGIDQMLPAGIEMIHGPGCPVCVTPLELIDKALAIAAQPGVIFCSFGDMLRVPGTEGDLFQVKGAGGDVRVVYSPLDAVEIGRA